MIINSSPGFPVLGRLVGLTVSLTVSSSDADGLEWSSAELCVPNLNVGGHSRLITNNLFIP